MYHYAARGGPSHGHRWHAEKVGEDRTCSSGDMIADRHTHRERERQTDRHAHHNTPLPYRRRSNENGARKRLENLMARKVANSLRNQYSPQMYNVGERYLKCFFKLKNVTRIFFNAKRCPHRWILACNRPRIEYCIENDNFDSRCQYAGWQLRNIVPNLCQLIFAAIL